MTIIAPTPITELPLVPSLSDVSTFSARTDAFINALPAFRSENNALATNVYNNAVDAASHTDIVNTQAGIATTQAGIATTQAGIATTQATNAIAAYDAFDDRYLGAKSGDPGLDNDGGALLTGAMYFNTTLNNMRIYTGAVWVTAAGAITGNFSISRETHSATASQTLFNLTNSYTPGLNTIMVYKNGARLLAADYTETSGSSITLAAPAAINDELFFEIGVVSSGTSTNAGNITFNPAGSIASSNVQDAIVELDSEKQPNLISGTNIKTLNGVSLLGSGNTNITPQSLGSVFSLATHTDSTISADLTLTSASTGAHSITSTIVGACVILPVATTMTAGQQFTIRNTGAQPIGIRYSDLKLAIAIPGGKLAKLTVLDVTTAAGVWAIEGEGLTAGLITIDSVFSSTYKASVPIGRAASMTDNLSVHFVQVTSGGFAAYAIDSLARTIGTPVTVDSGVSITFMNVFPITSSTCIAFWKQNATYKCAVIAVTGTAVTVGTIASFVTPPLTASQDDGISKPTLVALTTTTYLICDNNTTVFRQTVVTVSGTTCTIGTAVDTTITTSSAATTIVHPLTATTALVSYSINTGPWQVVARVVSVSGTVPTPGTECTISGLTVSTGGVYTIAVLSPTSAIAVSNLGGLSQIGAAGLTVSGTTVTSGAATTIESSMTTCNPDFTYRTNRRLAPLTASTAILFWVDTGSGQLSRAVILTNTANALTFGAICKASYSGANNGTWGYGEHGPANASGFLGLTLRSTPVGFGSSITLTNHTINGTTISTGATQILGGDTTYGEIPQYGVQLNNGDYVFMGSQSVGVTSPIEIVRVQHGQISHRGRVETFAAYGSPVDVWGAPNLGNGTAFLSNVYNSPANASPLFRICRLEVAV